MYSVKLLLVKRNVRRPSRFLVRGRNLRHRLQLPLHKRDVLPFVIRRYATNEESNDSGEKRSHAEYNQYRNQQRAVCKALLQRVERTGNRLSPLKQRKKEIRTLALPWPRRRSCSRRLWPRPSSSCERSNRPPRRRAKHSSRRTAHMGC